MALARSYTGNANQTGGSGASLSASVAIGAADAARRVVACVEITTPASPASAAFTISGVAASIDETLSPTQYIVSAMVPTGTTASVACTVTGTTISAIRVIGAYRLVGSSAVYDATSGGASGSSASAPLAEKAGGATIAVAFSAGAIGWTYPSENTEPVSGKSAASSSPAANGTATVAASGSTYVIIAAVHYREQVVEADAVFTLGALSIAATNVVPEATVASTLGALTIAAEAEAGRTAEVGFTLGALAIAAIVSNPPPVDAFVRALHDRRSREAIILLVTIEHPSLAEPKRVALSRRGHDIVSNGRLFTAVYFDTDMVSDTEGTPSARIRLPNVNREIGLMVDEFDEPPTFRMDIVAASNPNKIERSWTHLVLKLAVWNGSQIEAEIGQRDFSRVPWPALAATPAFCRALHK